MTCGERRRRVLKLVELLGGWSPMCFNCAGQVLRLAPLPPTLEALREAVSRERRRADRRVGKPDTRVFRYERRVGDRRLAGEGYAPIEDDMIVEVSLGSFYTEGEGEGEGDGDGDGDLREEDATRIRELVDLGEPRTPSPRGEI